ncbi:MAG: nuclear transport factor 2 family protein [Zoogloea oleivorans]|uniref:nuclear transport factor 2 family protein n=1 Tax=Zoogloea oleivorans TaxID=1552750 RepID=UPI002A3621BF|nr:nuclear transport factor 2 family protein [Zoogloea oleivorans]MDY0035973.1 nuclear transport factor 2 family protein [Zoogloea oleivorans]
MSGAQHAAGLARVVAFYETLSPQSLACIGEVYAPDARFKDPFNEVQGLAAIENVFRHMYRQVHEPRFRVTSSMSAGTEAWLAWEFHFRFQGWRESEVQLVRGATHLRLAPDGRVTEHRDYWDTGEELFARLPLLGGLMRFLRRRLGAS